MQAVANFVSAYNDVAFDLMEKSEIRRQNLIKIWKKDFAESQKNLADAIERSEPYMWQLLFGKQQRFGERIARHIEAKLKLKPLSLDSLGGATEQEKPLLDVDVLRRVIAKVNELMQNAELQPTPDLHAEVVAVFYDDSVRRGCVDETSMTMMFNIMVKNM